MQTIEKASLKEMFDEFPKWIKFQKFHNFLRKEIEKLRDLVEENKNNQSVLPILVRSCIKELYSLIEGDIFLINQFNPFPGFDDKQTLTYKFKKTFKHHARVFQKEELRQKYNSKEFESFLLLKNRKDFFSHPKNLEEFRFQESDLVLFDRIFKTFTDYVHRLMENIGLQTQISI